MFHSIYGKNYMVYSNQRIRVQSLNFTPGLQRLVVISKDLKAVHSRRGYIALKIHHAWILKPVPLKLSLR